MLTPPRRRSRSRPKVEGLEARQLLASDAASAIVQASAVASGAPQVSYVQFEPLTGRIEVTFTGDLAGYNDAELTNPANYTLTTIQVNSKVPTQNPSRPKAGVVLAPEFRVTGVTLTTPAPAGTIQSVIVSVNNNQPLRPGTYRFTIHSTGITDLAGRNLDGEYFGVFPSGDGQPGGDFVAQLAQVNNTVLPALPTTTETSPLVPASGKPTDVFLPSTKEVRVRIGKSHPGPGRFLLANGNNVTLVVVPGQHFPGRYRLPAGASPVVHAKAADHAK